MRFAWVFIAISVFNSNSNAEIFRRSHVRSFSQRPTATPIATDYLYPTQTDGKTRVAKRIGNTTYFVIFSQDETGYPIAEITHFLSEGRWVPIAADFSLARISQVTQVLPNGRTFAFVFENNHAKAYAYQIPATNGKAYWSMLPRDTEKKNQPNKPEWYRMPSDMEKYEAVAKGYGDELESDLERQRNDPRNLNRIHNRGAAFQRFLHRYSPNLPTRLPDKDSVLVRTGLKTSEWGSRKIFEPEDPDRPGILIIGTEQSMPEINKTVADLRSATTRALLRRAFSNPDIIRSRRANSIIIAKPGKVIDEAIEEANQKLKTLPLYVAARAVREAEARTGSGLFASASWRVEHAARGGLGRRRFNSGLHSGLPQAVRGAENTVSQTAQIVAQRALQQSYHWAARIKAEGILAEKLPGLIGFEVDFSNRWADGIQYFAKTTEGTTYLLLNVGKSFQLATDTSFLPAREYARFNAALLAAYERSETGLSKRDLYKVALDHFIAPSENGAMKHISRSIYTPVQRTAIQSQLRSLFKKNGNLSEKDIHEALSRAKSL